MSVKDGGPAFPWAGGETPISEGMSLRDWFAGQAMAGCAAHVVPHPDANPTEVSQIATNRAIWAYCFADAMLAAREMKPSRS